MTVLQNLHQHSTWCDGKNTPEEIVEQAIEQGFDSIGFSSHIPLFYAERRYQRIEFEGCEAYRRDIRALRERYRGRIDIFCGIENDLYSAKELSDYDYVIGSVHYLKFGEEYVSFDRPADIIRERINTYFGGDGLAYAKAYYEALASLPAHGRADIVGHFDLLTKHSEREHFIDTESPVYRALALEALDALVGKIPFFEINTGAIARGYRTMPYPAPFLLRALAQKGGRIIISSDCHRAECVSQSFSDAADLAAACGFRETYVLGDRGFCAVSLRDMKERLRICGN